MKTLLVFLFSILIICLNDCNQSGNNSAGKPIRTGPAIEVVESEIDLGTISAKETEIVGQVLFTNPGSEPLEIKQITGPCSCFAGSVGAKLIPPGEAGELEIRFHKEKNETGRVRKQVEIETNDPENKIAPVYFTFTIKRDRLPMDKPKPKPFKPTIVAKTPPDTTP